MANDSIWIRCTFCNERTRVTKYYPSRDLSPVENPERLIEFLNNHLDCNIHSQNYETDLNGNPGLEFVTENGLSKLNKLIDL